jgi:hypothetical protein
MEPSCYSIHFPCLTWFYNKIKVLYYVVTTMKQSCHQLNNYISFLISILLYLMKYHTHWSHFNWCNLDSWMPHGLAMWKAWWHGRIFFHINSIYKKNSKYLFKFTFPIYNSHSPTHEITSPQIWDGLGVDTHILPLNMVNMIHVVKREVGNKDGI